MRLIKVAGK